MKTVTFNENEYALVPLEPSKEMIDAAWIALALDGNDLRAAEYRAMLAAVPDVLPGVVTHSGEPYAWLLLDQGCRAPDDCEDYERLEIASEMFPGDLDRFIAAGRATGLYIHPAPDAQAIVAATLEAAAKECARMMMFEGGKQASFAHDGVFVAAQAIRTISPQDILDGLK